MKASLIFIMIILSMSITIAEEGEDKGRILVNGQAEVLVQPDYSVISMEVESWDKELSGSKKKNDKLYEGIIQKCMEYGINDTDIKSDQIKIYTNYEKDKVRIKENVISYELSRKIEITLRDLSQYEQLITELIGSGVTDIKNISFMSSKYLKYKREALLKAVKSAKEKAEQMAAVLGKKIGEPIKIDENAGGNWRGFTGSPTNAYIVPGGEVETISTKTGKISITQNVSVVFELE